LNAPGNGQPPSRSGETFDRYLGSDSACPAAPFANSMTQADSRPARRAVCERSRRAR
jgi:hypothetical protein